MNENLNTTLREGGWEDSALQTVVWLFTGNGKFDGAA